jgi:hypothetical protein
MGRHLKLTVWGLVLALAPIVVFVGATSYRAENGVVTEYSYLNLAAVAGGVAAAAIAVVLLRRDPGGVARPAWVVPVCVLLLVLGAFQVVRGLGLFPGITGCEVETGLGGMCTPTVF